MSFEIVTNPDIKFCRKRWTTRMYLTITNRFCFWWTTMKWIHNMKHQNWITVINFILNRGHVVWNNRHDRRSEKASSCSSNFIQLINLIFALSSILFVFPRRSSCKVVTGRWIIFGKRFKGCILVVFVIFILGRV